MTYRSTTSDDDRDELPEPMELAAALVTAPPGTVLSHRTAAQLFGLWIPRFDRIEVTTPATWRGSSRTTGVQRRNTVAHRRVMDAQDTTLRHGLPVTGVARTWLDLSPLLGIHDLVAAGDSALRIGCDRTELEECVGRARPLRGVRRARVALPLLNARSRSRPESRIRCALVLAGLPAPRVNEAIYDSNGGWLAEPDMHYPEAKVALEFNGRDHAGPARMRKDATRLLGVQRERWEVRTYTAIDAYQQLDGVVVDVLELLRRRAPDLLAAHVLGRQTAGSRRVRYQISDRLAG